MAEYTIDKIEYGGNVYKLQDTDEKLKVEAVSASEVTSYFPIVSAFSATDAAIRQRDTTGFEYEVFSGTTSSTGAAGIRLGNKTATGTAGNKKGFITIYGTGVNATTIYGPSGGTASYNVWLPNNGGTLALTTDIPTVYDWAKASTKPSYTASEVGLGNVGNFKAVSTVANQGLTSTEQSNARANIGAGTSSLTIGTTSSTAAAGNHTHDYSSTYAAKSHTHGNIQNGGTLQTNDITIANGDKLVVTDSSDSAKVARTSISFDGSTSTKALTPKGTWETFSKFSGSYNDLSDKPTIPTNTDEKIKLTSQSTSGTYPLIFGPASITSNSTYQGYYNTGITVNPSTKTVTATTFVGALTGTASGNLTSSSTLDATKLSGTIPSSCYTNTTYGISGSLSNHAFTSTLTAGGSGTTSILTLAAGTGITLTDDTTNKKITIACSVTNTDTKVSTAAVTSGTTYYPILGSDTTSAATKFYDKTGISYVGTTGSSVNGIATLTLGNNATGGSGKYGKLTIYSASQYGATFKTGSAFTADRTFNLPDKNGTIALTRDLDSYLNKPTGNDNPFGWKLTCDGSDTPVWDPPETYIIGISDDLENPGLYTLMNSPDDIRNAWSSTTFILDLGTYNSSTTYNDTCRLVNYRIENIVEDNDYLYQIIWFSGIKNCWVGGKVRTQTILCGIYLDSEEQYHTDGEVIVKISDNITASGKMYFGPENDELRGVKFNTIDSPNVQISANSTANFTATYTPPQENQRTFLTGVYVRSTGTNYSRVFLYGLSGTRDDNTGAYTFTCSGRNTYSSAATVSVRFRFLTVTVLDSADSGND